MPLADLTALNFERQLNTKANEEKGNQPNLNASQPQLLTGAKKLGIEDVGLPSSHSEMMPKLFKKPGSTTKGRDCSCPPSSVVQCCRHDFNLASKLVGEYGG